MRLQQTINDEIYLSGLDPCGGTKVDMYLRPGKPGEGIIFQTSEGNVKASLEHAAAERFSVSLRNGAAAVLNVEHVLATLWVYGVDNCRISTARVPDDSLAYRSYNFFSKMGLAPDIELVPNTPNREMDLCNKLDEVGLVQQDRPLRVYLLQEEIGNERLLFRPMEGRGVQIKATTDYEIPGEESIELFVTPETYRDEISRSRPYAKQVPTWASDDVARFIASVVYFPHFGIGTGFGRTTTFMPVEDLEQWRKQENYRGGGEIARHSAMDRLGAVSFLSARLDGAHIEAKFSNHANDIEVMKQIEARIQSP